MSKLFKLKKWLSLDDTCKRLSTTLEEEVNIKDLIQLIVEGDLKVSWYFQRFHGKEAVEVIKDNVYVLDSYEGENFLATDTPLKYITDAQSSIADGEAFRVYVDNEIRRDEIGLYHDYRVSSPVFDIEGVFNIHIKSGDMKVFFENILFEHQASLESKYFEGIIVENQENQLFKIVCSYIDEEDKAGQNIGNWTHSPFPIKSYPKISDLVILRTDLEKFEHSFQDKGLETTQYSEINSNIHFNEKITATDTWKNLYKITEEVVDSFPVWQKSQKKPNKIPMAHIDDWLMNIPKTTNREAETIKKIIVEIFNL